jgi:hypothetical protein
MAYASAAAANPGIRMPRVAMPKFRWPLFSPRTRALLMMAIMISPCFLCDTIGYCVKRFFYTPEQIAERQATETILSRIRFFHVACPDTGVQAAEGQPWATYAAQQGWPSYSEAGPGCFKPDRNLQGVVGLTAFNVACPSVAFSALDGRRWIAYAADHDWAPYPQAGPGCVDP